MAEFYGIGSLNAGRAYVAHPLLGPRLILCTETVLALQGRSLHAILGSPDNMKFRSSLTLFSAGRKTGRGRVSAGDRPPPDERTVALCQAGAG